MCLHSQCFDLHWSYLITLVPPYAICWFANIQALIRGEEDVEEREGRVTDRAGIARTWQYKVAQILTIFIPYRLIKKERKKDREEDKIQLSIRLKLIR